MIRSNFEDFIKKYYLGGLNESVKFISKDNKLTVSSITDNKLLRTAIEHTDCIIPDSEFGVSDTTKLLRMIKVLDDNVKVSLQDRGDAKITSITFSDDNTDVTYVTSDLSVIPSAGVVKKLPTFDVEIVVNSEFVDRYLLAKTALNENTIVTFKNNKAGDLEMIIGHSVRGLNTTKIKIKPTVNNGKSTLTKDIHFNADHFKEILNINKDLSEDSTVPILYISSNGLLYIKFEYKNMSATYYMVEITGE